MARAPRKRAAAPTNRNSRRIEHRRVADLLTNPLNPKAHDIALIDDSLTRFGFIEPVLDDGRTGQLIAGHGRLETLRIKEKRGDTPPEGIDTDDDGAWTVPVVIGWHSTSDADANAALIALNRTTELGGWEDQSLFELLDSLAEVDDGFAGVGFDEDDLDDLRARLEEVENSAPTNSEDTPSLTDYAERYEEQGRRLIVLDYNKEEYAQVTARLKLLRRARRASSNSEALFDHLVEVFPEVTDDQLTEAEKTPKIGDMDDSEVSVG